ncbi:hypothetical protein [Kineococcus aurantiacus]|uniref:REase AHJR-like domain-containing protein n=1 Tax=Kineococcus aurantiacus TaxID=37633 RepID=A0A7Y9J157_9ACTN|nr:hypothetical protein [Kineococcus aurantiacus]NYD22809.1 hypothetical protein [Kineococcus aurantiacus]
MSTSFNHERSTASEVALDLQREGWAVVVEPSPKDLPLGLQNFHPDLVARRGDENLIIEVKGVQAIRRNPALKDQIDQMSAAVDQLPNWSFRLMWLGEEAENTPLATALDRAEKAVRISSISVDAGLLLVWAAVESVLTRAVTQEDASFKDRQRPLVGPRLLENAFDLDLFDSETYLTLSRALKTRSRIAHGGESKELTSDLVEWLAEWVRRFSIPSSG